MRHRIKHFVLFIICVATTSVLAVAGTLTDVQRAQLDAMIHADRQGLEPADYRVDYLQELAHASEPPTQEQFSAALATAFERFAHDLAYGRLPTSSDPQWRLPTALTQEGLLPPPAFDSVASVHAYLDRVVPPHPQYRQLREALGRYLDIAQQGGWPAVPTGDKLHAGLYDERVIALRNRLRISGHYTSDMQANPLYFDAGLDEALRRFQSEQGLRPDGILDARTCDELNLSVDQRIEQLRLALERWRWLPRDLGARYVWINISSQDLVVMENDQPHLTMRVITGRPYRQTPSLQGVLKQVTFNPTWTVPYKIAVEDILPRQQRNLNFLAQKHIRVFSLQDESEINPTAINWSRLTPRNFTYQLRQDAGADNSLGRLKFSFDNPYDIYLHDTPSKVLFHLPTRNFSAGCVRIEDPLSLAQYLLSSEGRMSPEQIDRALASSRTRTVTLRGGVPIYLVYLTAWVDADAGVHFRHDVYDRDRIVGLAWAAQTARRDEW